MKKAQSLIEYVLILILISMIAISTLHFLGKRMSFSEDKTEISPQQNVEETMTKYCESKGMVFSFEKQDCVAK